MGIVVEDVENGWKGAGCDSVAEGCECCLTGLSRISERFCKVHVLNGEEAHTVIVGTSLPGCLNCSVTISVISPLMLYCI